MSEITSQTLSGVSETLLIPLYLRAMESQRPDALIRDEKSVELVNRMSYDFDRVRQIPLSEENKLVIILRNRELDRYARDFLARRLKTAVVHIGCGLDSRFDRVDNGKVEWYDLDLPEVIDLRRRLIGGEGEATIFWAARCSTTPGWRRLARTASAPSFSWPRASSCTL